MFLVWVLFRGSVLFITTAFFLGKVIVILTPFPSYFQGVYGGKITNPWDLRYVEIVTCHVIKETALQQHSSLTLGSTNVPVPPANVDPADYSKWFKEKTGTEDADLNSIQALGLDASVEREYNETRCVFSLRVITPVLCIVSKHAKGNVIE